MPNILWNHDSEVEFVACAEPGHSRSAESSHWELVRTAKYARYGVSHVSKSEDTIRRITPLLALAGVTRVGEITHLDRIGIPNFVAVRPRDRGSAISYYNGKGCTVAQARVSAIMEAYERYSGEHCVDQVVCATYDEIRQRGPAVNPAEILVPTLQSFHSDIMLEWVCGFDLIRSVPAFVPLNSVVCPYRPKGGEALYFSSTNGLAAGNTRLEALCQAMCEVLERDAESMTLGAKRQQIGRSSL